MNNFFVCFFILLFSVSGFSQKRINRYKHKQRQGKWIIYSDSTNTVIDSKGRYRKGNPVGKFYYYNSKGQVIKLEKYRFNKIRIAEFYANGQLKKLGKARIVISKTETHFYYYGPWQLYDSAGMHTFTVFYKDGQRTSEINHQKSAANTLNDSLIRVIRSFDPRLSEYRDSLLNTEKAFGKNSKEYNRIVSLNNLNSLKVLDDIDKIIQRFGYPGRTLVGADYAIVFSIISSATISYKEKYYNSIIAAADKKELDWADVAFFVDKVKVAKKEKQIYGTQYQLRDSNVLFYPIDAIEQLNERRAKAGLEAIETDKLSFLPDSK